MALVAIPTELLDAIKAQGEAAYPHECCGLLVGSINPEGITLIRRVVPSPNVSQTNAKDSFEVDAKVRFHVMRSVEDTSEDIIGHYHSHPDHPAQPSNTDISMAYEPEFVWLIVAVEQGQATDVKAWRLNHKDRSSAPLTLIVSKAE